MAAALTLQGQSGECPMAAAFPFHAESYHYHNPIYLSLQCYHVRARKKISEDERIGEQEVEIWKEFFRQMLYQRMKMMEEEEMMLEVTQKLFTKG